MAKAKPKAEPQSADESPFVRNHGSTSMVVELPIGEAERAEIDKKIHALMDMEAQVEFHRELFTKQLGDRLKQLKARRLTLHGIWKEGKGRSVVEVDVIVDDRAKEVMRVSRVTGDVLSKRPFTPTEQLEMFGSTPDRTGVPEMDDTQAKQFRAEKQMEEQELDRLLTEVDWSAVQEQLREQLGLTLEEMDPKGVPRKRSKKKDKLPTSEAATEATTTEATTSDGEAETEAEAEEE